MTIVKHFAGYREHRYELLDEQKKQPTRIFIRNELATKVVTDCRTSPA